MAERFRLLSEQELKGVFQHKILEYLHSVPFSLLIDLEDEEYRDMQVRYALVQEEGEKLYLFEFDLRNRERLEQVIGEPRYFYVQMLYEEVPL